MIFIKKEYSLKILILILLWFGLVSLGINIQRYQNFIYGIMDKNGNWLPEFRIAIIDDKK